MEVGRETAHVVLEVVGLLGAAVATVASLGLAGLLVWYNHRLWLVTKASSDAAQEAAVAAENSVAEAREMRFADNLPALLVQTKPHDLGGSQWSLNVINMGKGPAVLSDLTMEAPVLNAGKFKHTTPLDSVFLAVSQEIVYRDVNRTFYEECRRQMGSDVASATIDCSIRYTDFFGVLHEQSFRFKPPASVPGRHKRIG